MGYKKHYNNDGSETSAYDSENSLAYGYMMILLYFGAAVLIWLSWTYAYDIFLGEIINPSIIAGDISLQTASATAWNVNFMRYAPPIILLFGFCFAVNWAIFKSGGGSITFSTFWWGFLAFLICCVTGLIMAYWGGMFIDMMMEEAITLPGHDSDFATKSEYTVFWFVNFYYLVCYFIPVLGAIIFGQSIVKRVRASAYYYR